MECGFGGGKDEGRGEEEEEKMEARSIVGFGAVAKDLLWVEELEADCQLPMPG